MIKTPKSCVQMQSLFFRDSNMMNFNFIPKKMSLFLCTPRIDFLPCEVKKPIISRLSDFSCSCSRSIIAVWIKCFSFISLFDHIVVHNLKCTNCLQLLITDLCKFNATFAVSSQPPSTQICAFSMQFAVSSQSPSIQICGFCNT